MKAEQAVDAPVAAILQASSPPKSDQVERLNCRQRLHKELQLQAAIMQLAPNNALSPCRHSTCCWRWAATRLLDEAARAQRCAVTLREAFDEELGDSALQKLINLEQVYAELQNQLMATSDQLECQKRSCSDLEIKLADAELRASQELTAREKAEQARAVQMQQMNEMAARMRSLEAQLSQYKSPQERINSLEKRCRDLEIAKEEAEEGHKRALKEMEKHKDRRAELELKNRELAAFENYHLNKKKSARRAQKSEGGLSSRKEALRPGANKSAG